MKSVNALVAFHHSPSSRVEASKNAQYVYGQSGSSIVASLKPIHSYYDCTNTSLVLFACMHKQQQDNTQKKSIHWLWFTPTTCFSILMKSSLLRACVKLYKHLAQYNTFHIWNAKTWFRLLHSCHSHLHSLHCFLTFTNNLSHLLFECWSIISPHDCGIQVGRRFIVWIIEHGNDRH